MTQKSNPDSFACRAKCKETAYQYDLIVLGGGSGGLATAKEAASLGAKVVVLDFVTPTPIGTKWGIGGTCVNVGCIPKKLMHQAAILGEQLKDAPYSGWQVPPNIKLDWFALKEAVQDHIKSVNWLIKTELVEQNIRYINGSGVFTDPHTILVTGRKILEEITGKYILIAVGGRPNYMNIPGAVEYGITSDDLFSLDREPGKTLILGAGYIALECAGFLNSFGYNVTVMNRTKVALRRFDQQMACLLVHELEQRGIQFLYDCKPLSITKSSSEKLTVTWTDMENNQQFSDDFDTVMFAIARTAKTKELNLEKAGVIFTNEHKIDTVNEQTNVPHIYAVGDVLNGKPELTPVAISAGKLIARRLFGKSKETMNYDIIGSTVFTPLEYGFVGLSEEESINQHGEANIEVYHMYYKPMEFTLPGRSAEHCYLKVITMREDAILGMHFLGLNAGEVIQGFVTALKCGLTWEKLISTVGVHITNAEQFTELTVTKRSGVLPDSSVCCS